MSVNGHLRLVVVVSYPTKSVRGFTATQANVAFKALPRVGEHIHQVPGLPTDQALEIDMVLWSTAGTPTVSASVHANSDEKREQLQKTLKHDGWYIVDGNPGDAISID